MVPKHPFECNKQRLAKMDTEIDSSHQSSSDFLEYASRLMTTNAYKENRITENPVGECKETILYKLHRKLPNAP